MSRPISRQETLTFNPSGYTGNTDLTASTSTNTLPSNGYHGYSGSASTSNSARWTTSTNAGYVYYTFSISGIPSNATIISVACTAKIWVNNTSRVTNTNIQLYANTTAKGTSSTFASTSSSNTVTLNTGTSWTVSEANNIRLRFGGTKGNNTGYIYFYGADLSITYSINGTEYEVISTLATNNVDSILPAGQTWVFGGDSYELSIFADSSEGIEVTDNGVNVTDQLVLVHVPEISSTYTCIPSSYDSANSDYASTYTGTAESALAPYNGSNRFCVYVAQTAYAEAKLVYNFDCSAIPQNAIITSVTCKAGAACYSNGQYFDTRTVQLYSGGTAKGTATTITGTGNTNTEHNINGGSWTRAELDNAKIVIRVVRGNNTTQASFSFWGATLSISYTIPEYEYYTYMLTNVSADHTIIVGDSIIEIPDEDPNYNYYPITISSINADTDPERGTTRLIEASDQTITIYPSDPSITLILDNGVDVSDLLVSHGSAISDPSIVKAPNASYGFTLNNSEYYESQNKGVTTSAAVARVSFDLPVSCLVTIQYINYAEGTYDYGIFGNIDSTLGTTSAADSNVYKACSTSSDNTSTPQTLTYEISAGEHFIDIKYRKDSYTDSNNDSLQFKILNIEPLEPNNYYTYTLSNIQESHSLIFVFGDVTYYFVNSSGTNSRLFPSGSMVQLPGDSYRLTIVPDDYSYNITVIDNNVDVTANVQRKEEEITKDGVTTTVVNFIYTLMNIQTTHDIVVMCSPNEALYIKINGSYVMAHAVYRKVNGSWTQVSLDTLTDETIYVRP